MSEDITATVIALPDLRNRIKAEDSKARSIAKKSLEHVIECGRLLIELKSRVNHGNWKYEARQLNMSPRTISNYMRLAKNGNVAVLGKGVRDALRLLSIAENPPAPPPRPADIVLDAEIVVHAPKAETPDEMFQRGLDSLQETMPRADFLAMLERALEGPPAEPQDPPAPAVAAATRPAKTVCTSPAKPPQVMAILVFEIHKTLPKLTGPELEDAHKLLIELTDAINRRWLNKPSPSTGDQLAACWASASPEDKAAFLETAHLTQAP